MPQILQKPRKTRYNFAVSDFICIDFICIDMYVVLPGFINLGHVPNYLVKSENKFSYKPLTSYGAVPLWYML